MPNPIKPNNSNSSNTINKAPPFLELSKDTIKRFGSSDLDVENVLSVWTGLTKCSEFIKDGKRLENMSWRIVNRNIINKDLGERKPQNNKLKDGDFMSLLAIVAEQNLLPKQQQLLTQRPQLSKKKSSTKNLSRRLNISNESLEKALVSNKKDTSSQNLNNQKPSLFQRKVSSSKLIQQLSVPPKPSAYEQQQNLIHKSKQSEFDLAGLERNADLYDQPNPKYAFGIYDHSANTNNSLNNDLTNSPRNERTDDSEQPPSRLPRTDTSTSIVRGFSTNTVSVKKLETDHKDQDSTRRTSSDSTKDYEAPVPTKSISNTSSLFENNHTITTSAGLSAANSTSSLFQQQRHPITSNNSNTSTASLFHQPQIRPQEPQPEAVSQAVSLFANNNQQYDHQHHQYNNNNDNSEPKNHSHHHHHHHHHHHKHHSRHSSNALSEELTAPAAKVPERMKSPIFEQVNISPDLRPRVRPKRNNILNNFNMTSLAQHEQSEKNQYSNGRDRNMFFIESSPSPTDSVGQYIDNRLLPQIQKEQNSVTSSTANTIVQQPDQAAKGEIGTIQNFPLAKSDSKSLFSGAKSQPRRMDDLDFSSDDSSISDESDWSSMSDGGESDVDDPHEVNEQWTRTVFKRGQTLPKPEIKRSLLSGLFLNEMQDDVERPPVSTHTSQSRFRSSVNPGQSILSSSNSSANLHIKHTLKSNDGSTSSISLHRPGSGELHQDTAMVSTSHVNVAGLVSEPHHDHLKGFNEQVIERNPGNGSTAAGAPAIDQLSTSLSSMLSKSALNLSNYFSKQRKSSFSSILSDRAKTKYTHESRAPPTASTLLPTALATHMFLPNAHQKARSRLAAVVETSSISNETTRKNSTNIDVDDLKVIITEEQVVRSHPPTPKAIPKQQSFFAIDDDANVQTNRENKNNFNLSRKLSPKTTRRQMLATELSDSMRKSILWDRKNLYKTAPTSTDSVNNISNDQVYDSEIIESNGQTTEAMKSNYPKNDQNPIDPRDKNNGPSNTSSVTKKDDSKNEETSMRLKYSVDPDWEDETDFHTRGW